MRIHRAAFDGRDLVRFDGLDQYFPVIHLCAVSLEQMPAIPPGLESLGHAPVVGIAHRVLRSPEPGRNAVLMPPSLDVPPKQASHAVHVDLSGQVEPENAGLTLEPLE